MSKALVTKELSNALADIKSRIREGLVTANSKEVPNEIRAIIAESYDKFAKSMKSIAERLNVASYGLHLKMGRYAPNGKYKAHLWCAVIPQSVKAPSYFTTQLYVFRSDTTLAWGIGPSDIALKNAEFMKVYRKAIHENADMVRSLFKQGFVCREDFERREDRNEKSYVPDVEAFFESADKTLARVFFANNLPSGDELELMIESDLKKLMPLYLKVVETCTQNNLIQRLNLTEDDSEVDENADSSIDVDDNFQCWMMAPGENGRFWTECLEKSIISIGWDKMGDLAAYPDQDTLKTKYVEVFKPEKNPVMNVKGLFEFSHKIKKGDLIFAKQGRNKWLGYGRVISEYIFDDSRPEYKHYRKIEWIKTGEWEMPEDGRVTIKTLTNLSQYPDFLNRLKALIDGEQMQRGNYKSYTAQDALSEVFIRQEDFHSMIEALKYKKNIILQGPPGVGKTFSAKRIAYSIIGQENDSRIGFVQFHPSYAYEDFVQGIRPVDGSFAIKNGLFMDFCNEARRSEKPFVVIIDEINRGNLAKIFGELLLLIEADKRNEKVRLAYSQAGEEFSIPENLYIIGTMNTADRSLSLVDYALRRRFMFFTMKPEFLSQVFVETLKEMQLTDENIRFVQDKLSQLNSIIVNDRSNLGPGFEIGHSYFSRKPTEVSFEKWFASVVRMEIEPLLKEYWYDDVEKVNEITKTLKVA